MTDPMISLDELARRLVLSDLAREEVAQRLVISDRARDEAAGAVISDRIESKAMAALDATDREISRILRRWWSVSMLLVVGVIFAAFAFILFRQGVIIERLGVIDQEFDVRTDRFERIEANQAAILRKIQEDIDISDGSKPGGGG